MDISPLFSLPLPMQVHLVSAVLAVAVGPMAIYRRRRDNWHKGAGYVWVAAMVTLTVSAFWLDAVVLPFDAYTAPFETGFGVIHLLAFPVAWTLWHGIRAARAGRIDAHRAYMTGLYWQGLLVAGLFTLFPGRVLNRVFFPQLPELGFLVIFLGGALVFGAMWVRASGGRGAARGASHHPDRG